MEMKMIKIADIQLSKNYERFESIVNKDEFTKLLTGLSQNISEIGLINPISVIKSGKKFLLRAGYRRLMACRMLKWSEIPASVLEDNVEITIAENLIREDMTPLEIGDEIIHCLPSIEEKNPGKNREEIIDIFAKKLGKSSRYIYMLMRISENCTPEQRRAVKKGELTSKDLLGILRKKSFSPTAVTSSGEPDNINLGKKFKKLSDSLVEVLQGMLNIPEEFSADKNIEAGFDRLQKMLEIALTKIFG